MQWKAEGIYATWSIIMEERKRVYKLFVATQFGEFCIRYEYCALTYFRPLRHIFVHTCGFLMTIILQMEHC